MITNENQKIAANYMGAVAHALGGRPGRHREFIDKVEVILSGAEPDAMQLMQFTDRVRADGRPVLWIHHSADAPNAPQIGLVARDGGKVHAIENCMLWAPRGGGRLQLVPDAFTMGAFRFDDALRLRRLAKAPAADFDAGTEAMVRAYARLREIERAQFERGNEFDLPAYVPLRRAA
ncbi:hypothetical protein [Sphingomonas sp.]|jgi:hypothetical protein|uniref:hypothetical protein n=1 Tax=Sphingomonas sp. TaxID=28214 RepID=UPI002E314D20|nr:hypothetical protein [Sphingomonas sp.]HEX4694463.1 hypothetical protein [Sphingomonas sp.]